jgi:hypothetical protein
VPLLLCLDSDRQNGSCRWLLVPRLRVPTVSASSLRVPCPWQQQNSVPPTPIRNRNAQYRSYALLTTKQGRLFCKAICRSTDIMTKARKNVARKKRGRPATGQDPVTAIRLSVDLRERVDAWARRQASQPARSEAIRRLVEVGLSNSAPSPRNPRTRQAAAWAAEIIDRHADRTASADEQESRKRQLLRGPKEFRELRRDHSTPKRRSSKAKRGIPS